MNPTQHDNPAAQGPATPESLRLGVDPVTLNLAGGDDARRVAAALARQAQRSLLMHTPDLEAQSYDRQPFLDAVSALVRRHHGAAFEILLGDPARVVRDGHRLVELARRLGSGIRIRRIARQYRGYPGTFLLADDCGYLYRPLASRYEGIAGFNNPGEVSRLGSYFREVWEHSEPEMELRRLYL